jgi:hypothetical protein
LKREEYLIGPELEFENLVCFLITENILALIMNKSIHAFVESIPQKNMNELIKRAQSKEVPVRPKPLICEGFEVVTSVRSENDD